MEKTISLRLGANFDSTPRAPSVILDETQNLPVHIHSETHLVLTLRQVADESFDINYPVNLKASKYCCKGKFSL